MGSFAVYLIFLSLTVLEKASTGPEKDIVEFILADYGVTERPVKNKSDAVVVNVRLSLYQIMSLDIVEQSLTAIYFHELNWIDEYLKWNPDDFEGVETVRVLKYKIWLPDINVFQRINWADVKSLEQVLTNPIVKYDGRVIVQEPLYLVSGCSVNVKYFPVDTHVCQVNIGSYTYPPSEVDVAPALYATGTTHFVTNMEWNLINYTVRYKEGVEPIGNYSEMVFRLHLTRRPWFMLLNTVMPTSFTGCLTVINFLMPCESGEKMGYGITLFLALCVNLLAISSMLPQTGEELPVIQNFLAVWITMVAFSLFSTMLVLRLYHTEPSHKVPKILRKLVRKPKLSNEDVQNKKEVFWNPSLLALSGISENTVKIGDSTVGQTGLNDSLLLLAKVIGQLGEPQKKTDWMRLAESVDKIMAASYVLIFVSSLIYLMAVLSASEETKMGQ